jgi:hypothetical protein
MLAAKSHHAAKKKPADRSQSNRALLEPVHDLLISTTLRLAWGQDNPESKGVANGRRAAVVAER